MKQYINLYARLEPVKPAPRALIAIGAVCVLVLLGYTAAAGYLFVDSSRLVASLAAAKADGVRLNEVISQRQGQDQAIDLMPLEKSLEVLLQQQQRQQTLLAYLDDPILNNTGGFSEAMTGLARQHLPGVAIERLELTHKGRRFLMAGKIAYPTSLPLYMQRLGAEPAFARMSFEKINITEMDGQLDFEISSLAQVGGDS